MSEISLGFGPSPRPEYVYIDADVQPYPWYFFDHNEEKKVPIEHPALTGVVTAVETSEKEFRGKTNQKVQVHVRAGARNYVIETGRYTAFSRCMMAGLSRMGAANVSRPITIEPQPGKEKAVFAAIYNPANGGKVSYTYPKTEGEVDQLIATVIGFFKKDVPAEANGRPQPQNA